MTESLNRHSRALLARAEKECLRPPETAPTHLIGGMAATGAALDKFLRDLLVHTAALFRETPAMWMDASGLRVDPRRATAGQIALAIARSANLSRISDRATRVLVEDLQSPASRTRRFVNLRNTAVHEAELKSERLIALRDLCVLLNRYRKAAGWET